MEADLQQGTTHSYNESRTHRAPFVTSGALPFRTCSTASFTVSLAVVLGSSTAGPNAWCATYFTVRTSIGNKAREHSAWRDACSAFSAHHDSCSFCDSELVSFLAF